MDTFSFEEADRQIRSAAKIEAGRNSRNMLIGWYAARMKEQDAWTKHGYTDEAAYRDAAGVTVGVWGRYTRIAGELPKLSLVEFSRLSAENAEQLGMLPEELKYDFLWVERATNMKAEDFKRKVLEVKAFNAGVAPADMRVKFSLPMFDAQRTVIRAGIAEFSKEHAIKDPGTALEWLVLEYSGRKTFAAFLKDRVAAFRALKNREDAYDQLVDFLLAANEMLKNVKG
jgi:hypothetical protein